MLSFGRRQGSDRLRLRMRWCEDGSRASRDWAFAVAPMTGSEASTDMALWLEDQSLGGEVRFIMVSVEARVSFGQGSAR